MRDNQFSFSDFIGTLYKILETSTDDVLGLYETFWSLPEGKIADPTLGYSKKYPLSVISDLNEKLVRKGYLIVLLSKDLNCTQAEDTSVLTDPKNYLPFHIGSGPGYVLSATEKGATLRARIAKHRPSILWA